MKNTFSSINEWIRHILLYKYIVLLVTSYKLFVLSSKHGRKVEFTRAYTFVKQSHLQSKKIQNVDSLPTIWTNSAFDYLLFLCFFYVSIVMLCVFIKYKNLAVTFAHFKLMLIEWRFSVCTFLLHWKKTSSTFRMCEITFKL